MSEQAEAQRQQHYSEGEGDGRIRQRVTKFGVRAKRDIQVLLLESLNLNVRKGKQVIGQQEKREGERETYTHCEGCVVTI